MTVRWGSRGQLSSLNGLRLLIVANFVVLLVIAAVAVPTLVDTVQTLDREQAVYDATSAAVSDLMIGALNQETGVRGYALAGLPKFLEPARDGVTQYDHALSELRRTDLGPAFSAQVARTAAAFGAWRSLADQVVGDVRHSNLAGARALAEQTQGKTRFDAFRAAQGALSVTVRDEVRADRRSLHQKVVLSLIVLVAALAFGAIVGVGIMIWWRVWGRRTAAWERRMADRAVLLQAAIDASSDSIFAKNVAGRHILSNTARAAALSGGDSDARLIDRTTEDFLGPELGAVIREHELEVMSTGESRNFEEALPQPDGTHFYAVTKSPLKDSNGRIVGIVGVARDVTEERALLFDRERLYQLEHELAVTLQLSMLGNDTLDDERVDVCTRYLPAVDRLSVGGDWYDLFSLPDDRIGLAVGDAVGHGVESVTAMGRLRSAMAALVGLGLDPAATIEALDRFARQSPHANYATCLYAILDLSAEELSYSSAGQMPPILLAPDRGVRVLDGHQDPPLAVPNEGRHVHTIPFPIGSTIFVYTDGLVERRDEEIDTGLQRLADVLARVAHSPASDVCDLIVDELIGRDEQRDDIAMVAVRFVEEA